MNKIVIRKNGGFYYVVGEDCYILNYIMGYVIKNDRVGFPLIAFDKVIGILDDKRINYCVIGGIANSFGNRNKYGYFLELGKKKCSIEYRVQCIMSRMNSLSMDSLNKILDYIEGFYE